jgi:hypothetical protein
MISIKILLILISIIGIFMLIKGIMMLMQFFNTKIILEIPYTGKSGNFRIDTSGTYSIWQKGKQFTRTPVDKFKPVITNESTGEKVALNSSIFRTQVNNGATASMLLFKFTAPAGNYRLDLDEGSSISLLEKSLTSYIPFKETDPANYFLQVRETRPKSLVVFGIPLTIIGFGCFIGGIILFATFDQWMQINETSLMDTKAKLFNIQGKTV